MYLIPKRATALTKNSILLFIKRLPSGESFILPWVSVVLPKTRMGTMLSYACGMFNGFKSVVMHCVLSALQVCPTFIFNSRL